MAGHWRTEARRPEGEYNQLLAHSLYRRQVAGKLLADGGLELGETAVAQPLGKADDRRCTGPTSSPTGSVDSKCKQSLRNLLFLIEF